MRDLKLIALDAEDLAVLSAHLQDAVLRMEDIAYLRKEKRFAAVANRFDWEDAARREGRRRAFTRRLSGLRFERVLDTKVAGLNPAAKGTVLSLLNVTFQASPEPENPGGFVTLTFSGGGAIRLEVECIEAELTDLGAAWTTPRKPEHADDDPAPSA
jgi:hypothetical protein